ncbi:MAG: hypothetical protein ACYS80_17785 [Planctomycetota bacterium]|jgi:hypothetical protein
MVKKSTHGLKLDQLAELLSIGIDEANFLNGISDDKAIAEMLHERLITSLPKNASLLDSLMVIMGKMGYKMQSLNGKSLGDVLLDAQTDLGLLRAIKTYGKKLSLTVDSGSENAVAITIYHAAIASALVYHDQTISTSSYDTLDSSFGVLIDKKWMTPELKKLFSKAREICQKRSKEK